MQLVMKNFHSHANKSSQNARYGTLLVQLKAPLNSTLMLLESLLSHVKMQSLRRAVVASISQINQAIWAADDMIDLNSIEQGLFTKKTEEFNPREVIDRILETLTPEADQHQSKLVFAEQAESDNLPEKVSGDLARLKQVVVNMIKSMLMFGQGNEITLSARFNEQVPSLKFRVAGWDETHSQSQIDNFVQNFNQNEGFTKRIDDGSSLGLVVSSYVAKMYGGSVRVEANGPSLAFILTMDLQSDEQPRLLQPQTESSVAD